MFHVSAALRIDFDGDLDSDYATYAYVSSAGIGA